MHFLLHVIAGNLQQLSELPRKRHTMNRREDVLARDDGCVGLNVVRVDSGAAGGKIMLQSVMWSC